MANKSLFLEDYIFKGNQCEKVITLTSKIDNDSNSAIFSSTVELFIFASLVGCYYNHRAKPTKDQSKTTKIMVSQFITHESEIKLAFKFVLLTSNKECIDPVDRLNRTFRNPNTEENYNLFEEYMLGGIDEIYDKLIVDTNNRYEDYLVTLNKMLAEYGKEEASSDLEPSTENFF